MKTKTHAVIVVALAAVALTLTAVPAQAGHAWANYHWERASNPVTVVLGDNCDSTWDVWLQEASDDWSASSVLDSPVGPGQAKGKCRPTEGRGEVCNDTYGNTGWLGVAQIWANGDHIYQGTAKLNDTYHNSPPYNTDAWRDLVMCQEVGHIYGLGHQDEDFNNANLGTCMDYTSDPESNRQPNQHDYQQLEEIYAHLDDGGDGGCTGPPGQCKNGAPAAPPAFLDIELDGPGQWGELISVSRDGGQAVFVQDFGNGYKIYTHVTWTLEVAEGFRNNGH